MRLLIAPHAPTEWNAQRRYQGHVDIALSAEGHRQANQLAAALMAESIDEVHSSDLRRAVQTADAVAKPRQLPLHCESRLRELHFGAWEGLTYEEVCQRFPEARLSLGTNVPRQPPPGGETLMQLADRIASYFGELADQLSSERTILVVAHRGSLQVFLCLALGLPPEAWWKLRLEPASISEVNLYPDGAVLNSFNATQHLREDTHAR
jgi:broad specificity phosphatase PhoE